MREDWKYREAAVLAYGSIMEGPTSEKMRPMVEQSLSHLVMALQDPSVAVRDFDLKWNRNEYVLHGMDGRHEESWFNHIFWGV